MNRNETIDVLSVVAAATRRTVGESDVEIWHGIIGELTKDLALQAVHRHLRDCPGVWLEPGHVYQKAREIRRTEAAAEGPTPDYEALCESKAEDADELAANRLARQQSPAIERPKLTELVASLARQKQVG